MSWRVGLLGLFSWMLAAEYTFKAADAPGYTSIGVRGTDSVVFITQKKVQVRRHAASGIVKSETLAQRHHPPSQDKLVIADSVTNMHALTPSVGAVFTGIARE